VGIAASTLNIKNPPLEIHVTDELRARQAP